MSSKLSNKRINTDIYEFFGLEWDEDYFHIPCAKVILKKEAKTKDIKEITELSNDYEFITIVNKNNLPENTFLIGRHTNAFFTDMNVQFLKATEKLELATEDYFFDNCASGYSELQQIAAHSFGVSRFYNDPFLDQKKADNVYAHWVKTALGNPEKNFIVTGKNEKALGFILYSNNLNQRKTVIELIAVDSASASNGIGRRLLAYLHDIIDTSQIDNIQVGTQINNHHALNFYTSNRFKIIECNSIYHYWPKK